jgi:hypothetical protein
MRHQEQKPTDTDGHCTGNKRLMLACSISTLTAASAGDHMASITLQLQWQ